MKRRSVLGAIAAAAPGFANLGVAEPQSAEPPSFVSFVQVLARPETLDAKVVMTAGFVVLDGESSRLYLHREDFEACLLPNSVRVSLSATELANSCISWRWTGLVHG